MKYPTLETLEMRQLLASIDTYVEEVDEMKIAAIDDDETLQAVLQLVDAETDGFSEADIAEDSSTDTEVKKSKNPFKQLKHKVAKDASNLKYAIEGKTQKLADDIEAGLDRLAEITHINEARAELNAMKQKLAEEAKALGDDLSEGLDKLKGKAIKIVPVPILEMHEHLIEKLPDAKEVIGRLACLARIVTPDSIDSEEHGVEEKETFGDKLSDLMHHHVSHLQNGTDRLANHIENMPDGQRKELLMHTLSTMADAMASVARKIADFNEEHSEINEKRLNRMIFESHVGSRVLKYGSWGLKVSSGVLKLVGIGVPEAIPVAIAAGAAAGLAGVGSQALGMVEGDLPHFASEKSKILTGAAEAGHRREDIWRNFSERLHGTDGDEMLDEEALALEELDLADSEADAADEDAADTEEKTSKNPLKRIKHRVSKDASSLKHAIESKTQKLADSVEASLDKLGELTHMDEVKAELSVVKAKLSEEAKSLGEDLSEGLDKIKDGASTAKEKLTPILDLPSHLMDQISNPKEIISNLKCLASIINPDWVDETNEESSSFGDKLSRRMHSHVDHLQERTDSLAQHIENMPDGRRKDLLMHTLINMADAMGSVAGKIADFNEEHSDVNEKRLNRMIFEAHVGSRLLKYGSWGLKVSSGVLKLVSIGFPEALPAAIGTGVASGLAGVGSQALGALEGNLPQMAEEKSKIVTGAAEAGHRREDMWHGLADRLRGNSEGEAEQIALEEAMEAIVA